MSPWCGLGSRLTLIQGYCPASEPTSSLRQASSKRITDSAVRAHVERLASWEYAGRSGLGAARAALYIADHFHDKGYHVVATDYDSSLLSDLEGREGYSTAKLDVTKTEDVQQVAQMVTDEL